MIKAQYTIDELTALKLPGYPATVRGWRKKAAGWPYQEVPARGGRGGVKRLYVPSKDVLTQIDLKYAQHAPTEAARSAKTEAAKHKISHELAAAGRRASEQSTLVDLSGLSDSVAARMQARAALVAAYGAWFKTSRIKKSGSWEPFSRLYNCAAIVVETDVRVALPSLSPRSIQRWVLGYEKHGLAALIDEKDGSKLKGSGKIESQTELREFVVGMLVNLPHARIEHIEQGINARFGDRTDIKQPGYHAIWRFVTHWKKENASVFTALANPDRWKNQHMVAMGSQSETIVRLNQRWEMDSTPGDVMLIDGRHHLVGVIDVYSRRMKLLVTKTSKSSAVAAVVRRAILDWGVPESVKTDNGQDYKSLHLQRVFMGLRIEQEFCPPFQPWHKPHIERSFRTFAHGLVELLPGYIGHNVADRKELEARAAFADRLFVRDGTLDVKMTAADFQKFCDNWIENVYHQNSHTGLENRTPWHMANQWQGQIYRIENERALDVLLTQAPTSNGMSTVQKKGLRHDKAWFIAPELASFIGHDVQVRFAADDLGKLVVYSADGEFICVAECPERTGINRQEVAAKAKALQQEQVSKGKALLKQIAKRADTGDVVTEILKDRARQAGKLVELPVRQATQHTSAGLKSAAEAAAFMDGKRMTTSAQQAAEIIASRPQQPEPAPIVTNLPETPAQRMNLWNQLNARVTAGGIIESEQQRKWFATYPKTKEFTARLRAIEDQQEEEASNTAEVLTLGRR